MFSGKIQLQYRALLRCSYLANVRAALADGDAAGARLDGGVRLEVGAVLPGHGAAAEGD